MAQPQPGRAAQVGWVLLPLRAFLALVFLDAGVSKVADRRFLDASSPLSMRASVLAARPHSPIGGVLGPVVAHSFAAGLLMAVAEIAVGLGLLTGLFTRVAAAAGMLLALSLWLTVSWSAQPWFTSADLVYLLALTPLVAAGSGGVLSLDGWLAQVHAAHPAPGEDRVRRVLVAGGLAVLGSVLLAGATLFRRAPGRSTGAPASPGPATDAGSSTAPASGSPGTPPGPVLAAVADVPVGGGRQVTDPATQQSAWVLQLQPGRFTAYSASCPHQGCAVSFVSAADGFACPCHGSRFDSRGQLLTGPATRGLDSIRVSVIGGQVREG